METSTKQQVLAALQTGETLSGEHLSRQLNLSRAAVWKAVEALRRDGYRIESHTRVGYCLADSPDVLSRAEIARYGGDAAFPGAPIICHKRLEGSTNHAARALALTGAPHGTVVIADEQTSGRGRLGRSFYSPPGVGLYLSLLARPSWTPERLGLLTVFTAVRVCDAIEEVCGCRPQVKWVNDLLMGGRKVAGILTELSTEGESGRVESVVIGIGVNCHGDGFPPALQGIAGSIERASGRSVRRARLAAVILRHMAQLLDPSATADDRGLLQRYRADCQTVGQLVDVTRGEKRETGRALAISDKGGLIVQFFDRQEEIRSGEATLHTETG